MELLRSEPFKGLANYCFAAHTFTLHFPEWLTSLLPRPIVLASIDGSTVSYGPSLRTLIQRVSVISSVALLSQTFIAVLYVIEFQKTSYPDVLSKTFTA